MMHLSTFALIVALADAAAPPPGGPATVAAPPAATPAAAGPPASLPPSVAAQMLRVRGAEIVDGKGRPVVLRGVAFGNEVWANVRLPRQAPRRGRLPARRRDGDERGALLHELPDVRGRRGAGQVPRRRLAVAGRQHRLGQAPRRLPDPEHARAAGRLPVAGQRQGALGSPRNAGAPASRCGRRSRATARASRPSRATTC